MNGCCQGHLQRELLVPPVHAQPTVTTPLRCPTAAVAMHRHVDHWARTKGLTKKETHSCLNLLLLFQALFSTSCVCSHRRRTGSETPGDSGPPPSLDDQQLLIIEGPKKT